MIKIMLFCKPYLRKHAIALSAYILLCLLVGLFSLIKPYITGSFLDFLIGADRCYSLVQYCVFFLFTMILSIFIGYVSNRLYIYLQTKLGYELNCDMIAHVHKLRLSYLEKQDTAYLNQRINNDSNALMAFCISIVQNIAIQSVTLLVSVATIFSFDTIIATVLFVQIPIYFVIYGLLKKYIFSASFLLKEQQANFFGKLYEQFVYIKLLKIHSNSSEFLTRLHNSFDKLLKCAFNYQKTTYFFSGLDSAIVGIAQIFLFLYGGFQVISGKLSIGQFTIISNYFGIMLGSARYFFSLGKTVQDNMVSLKRLEEIKSLEQSPIGSIHLNHIDNISIKDYSKSYGENNIISNFSIKFTKGNIYTISGANGSGKTTIVNSTLGLDIGEYSGEISINGLPLEKIDMENARKYLFGVVEQEPVLFEDTIAYNIWLGGTGDEKKLNEYINMLGLQCFFSNLPKGLQTKIGESATNLSGGEKQKISIIRSLIKDPEVIILDEPTSALDRESSEKLKIHLQSIKDQKIIFIVSHDSSFHDISDTVISLP